MLTTKQQMRKINATAKDAGDWFFQVLQVSTTTPYSKHLCVDWSNPVLFSDSPSFDDSPVDLVWVPLWPSSEAKKSKKNTQSAVSSTSPSTPVPDMKSEKTWSNFFANIQPCLLTMRTRVGICVPFKTSMAATQELLNLIKVCANRHGLKPCLVGNILSKNIEETRLLKDKWSSKKFPLFYMLAFEKII